jgi:hypothetical protein
LLREIRGLGTLLAVLAVAGGALWLPQTTFAQNLQLSVFSSPPPGYPRLLMQVSAKGHLTGGVTVQLPVRVQCGPYAYGEYNTFSLTIDQVDQGVVNGANGSLSPAVVCDGKTRSYTGLVTLPIGSTPFTTGTATALLYGNVCGYNQNYQYSCIQATVTKSVQLQ